MPNNIFCMMWTGMQGVLILHGKRKELYLTFMKALL